MNKYKITQKMIAKYFGYASANSFNNCASKDRMIKGVELLIKEIEDQIVKKIKEGN